MTTFAQAAKLISGKLSIIAEMFEVSVRDIEVDNVEVLAFTVKKSLRDLANAGLSDTDFTCFCEQNNFRGVIFFEVDNVVFSMVPGNKDSELQIQNNESLSKTMRVWNKNGNEITLPRISQETFETIHVHSDIVSAVKQYREMTDLDLIRAKAAIEHGYFLECKLRGVDPNNEIPSFKPAELVDDDAP